MGDDKNVLETLKKLDRYSRLITVNAHYNAGLISEAEALDTLRRPLRGETKRRATDDSRLLNLSLDEIERELDIQWTFKWGHEE